MTKLGACFAAVVVLSMAVLTTGCGEDAAAPPAPPAPYITVTSPNGSEIAYYDGDDLEITWNSHGVTDVDIYYSTTSATGPWTSIDTAVANTGSYSWTVPDELSLTCYVWVDEAGAGVLSDTSDAAFAMTAATITLSAPAPSDVWRVGYTKNIASNSAGLSQIRIERSVNGSVWTDIEPQTTAVPGIHPWLVTGPGDATHYIRASDANDGSPWSVVGPSFGIADIVVMSPGGGEKWYYQGTEQLITWTAYGVPGIVDISYSSDNGQNWTSVATELASEGQYEWTIPDDVSAICLVKIEESVAGDAASDVSDVTFEIAPSTITIDAPAGGESWIEWTEQDISWAAPLGVTNVDILVSRDNGDSWSLIPGASGLGATSDPFTWTASAPTSSACRIRVRDNAEWANSGTSPAFTVSRLFQYEQGIAFMPTAAGVAWGDYDSDGWMDLLVSGYDWDPTTPSNVRWLYHNESDGGAGRTLVEATGHGIAPDRMASLSWADSDGDGDIDLLFQGYTNRTRYYTNDGDSTFTNVASPTDLYFQYMGCVGWADYDNDGDFDATVTGVYMDPPNPTANKTFVYVNDGAGTLGATPLDLPQGVNFSAVDWGDWDNDGDLDLAIIGDTDATATKTSYGGVFENDAGAFTASTFGTVFKLMDGDIEWGDFDGDGNLDLAAVGHVTNASYTGRILRNTGSDFEIAQYVESLYYASVAWGDVDNDGDLDLAVAGTRGSGPVFKLYRNEGGTLVDTGSELLGVYSGDIAWCDYDGDGDLDLAMAGNASATGGNFMLYRNDWPGVKNTAPSAPTIDMGTYPPLVGGAVVDGKRKVTFRWLPASDTQTTNDALLTYSLRITPAAGGNDVAPAMARTDGKRLVVRRGPIQASASVCQHAIWLADGADFDWAVQAIDTAFEGSAWATAPSSVTVSP